jgi:hypothetical protein
MYRWSGFEKIDLQLIIGTDSAGAQCPPSVPPGVTALNFIPQTQAGTLRVEWEDISDPCMGVVTYTVYAWGPTYQHLWTFQRAGITCSNGTCTAIIDFPPEQRQFAWYVKAQNALGTGPSDNALVYTAQ